MRRILTLCLATALLAGCAAMPPMPAVQNMTTNQQVGIAGGAALGAYVGHQFGGGTGSLLGLAAGAVIGGAAGYVAGTAYPGPADTPTYER